jgi:hypothetical protein
MAFSATDHARTSAVGIFEAPNHSSIRVMNTLLRVKPFMSGSEMSSCSWHLRCPPRFSAADSHTLGRRILRGTGFAARAGVIVGAGASPGPGEDADCSKSSSGTPRSSFAAAGEGVDSAEMSKVSHTSPRLLRT